MKAIHFGAGSIGRGFIGQVLYNNGIETVFIDINSEIINQINIDEGYELRYLDQESSSYWIDNVRGLNIINELEIIKEIEDSEYITTAIGVENLKNIAHIIKKGIIQRSEKTPVVIMANENVLFATDILENYIYEISAEHERKIITENATFLNTAIDRQSSLKTINGKSIPEVEPFYEWIIESGKGLEGLKGVKYVENLEYYNERKLFIVNAAHAAYAYVGNLYQCKTIQEAIKNERVNTIVSGFIKENIRYFVKKYKDDEENLNDYFIEIKNRFSNPKLQDTVTRVGRSPLRKLGLNERLIGPILKLYHQNLPYECGIKVVASALLFRNEDDIEAQALAKLFEEEELTTAIRLSIEVPETIIKQIASAINEIYENPKLNGKKGKL